MFWSKPLICKSNSISAWNLAFPVYISPVVWNMRENLHYESVYFKELHKEQELYWMTIIIIQTGLWKVAGCRRKIATRQYLVRIGRLLCLAFLYGWHFLNKISLDWALTLTTQLTFWQPWYRVGAAVVSAITTL